MAGFGFAYMGQEHGTNAKYQRKALMLEPIPEDLHYNKYSFLMGFLCTNGATFKLGYNWFWDYRTVYLMLSHVNSDFVDWLADILYSPRHFNFDDKSVKKHRTSNSQQLATVPSYMCYVLWLHWNEEGINLLPGHFSHYFSFYTLRAWAMKNGQWSGKYFYIHISRLNSEEKELLKSLIETKLGYTSHFSHGNSKLAIHSPEKLVEAIKPAFHESQLHRLVKKVR